MEWNLSTDVVVIGAGAAGLAAAVSARDHGAAVIVVEENYDIGGHAMLSGGRVHLGGGNALQKKFNINDSPDQVFADWVNYGRGDSRYNDRDLVRAFADECVPTFQFLLDNGVTFIEKPIVTPDASTVPRVFVAHEWHVPSEIIAPRRKRAQQGRADPAPARDDPDRARRAPGTCARHRRTGRGSRGRHRSQERS